jgi:hypothetical protein
MPAAATGSLEKERKDQQLYGQSNCHLRDPHCHNARKVVGGAYKSRDARKKLGQDRIRVDGGFRSHGGFRLRKAAVEGRSAAQRAASAAFIYIRVIGSGEPPTEVRLELSPPLSDVAPNESIVRLTVTQIGFQANSKVFTGCSRAWPEIVSSVKTYLETGRPLRFAWKH